MAVQHFFPLVFDSTQLSSYNSCQIRFFRNYVQHFQSAESIDLIAGAAFAEGIQKTREAFYEEGIEPSEALTIGIEALREKYGDFYDVWKPAKSVERMELALESYFNEYDLRFDEVKPLKLQDGSYSIEYSLLQPILDFEGNPILHPTLKLPLLFSGRLDMLAEYMGGIYQVDEKTTGSYFTKTWSSQWETRGQFSGYSWLGQQSNIPELQQMQGVVVRGVCLPSSTSTVEDTRNKFYSNIETIKHQQAITARSQYEVECWHSAMVDSVLAAKEKYIRYLENNEKTPEKFFYGAWGDPCTSYGKGCQFITTCKSVNGEKFLESTYDQFIWRPEKHTRQLLSDYLEELTVMTQSAEKINE